MEPKVPVNTGEPTVPPVRPPPFCGESTVLYGKGGGVRGNRRFPVTGVVDPVVTGAAGEKVKCIRKFKKYFQDIVDSSGNSCKNKFPIYNYIKKIGRASCRERV